MSALAATRPARLIPTRTQTNAIIAVAGGLLGLLLAALVRRTLSGQMLLPIGHSVWLPLHLMSVIPALPLGAYVLIRRKGDRLHKLLGRTWAGLMMVAALSSFGLHGLTGGFSWIHLLSILTLVAIPRAVIAAMRGNIVSHQRSMMRVYFGLVGAGVFTFIPGRLFGVWLFG